MELEVDLIESTVAALYASPISIEQITNADKKLQKWLNEPRMCHLVDPILSTAQKLETQFFALLVLEGFIKYGWYAVHATARDNLASTIYNQIFQFSSHSSRREKFYTNKLCFVLVQILISGEQPMCEKIVYDLLEKACTNDTILGYSLDILQLLSEEINEHLTSKMTSLKFGSYKIDNLQSISDRICGLCLWVLANSKKDELLRAALATLNSFLKWISLSDMSIPPLVKTLLNDNIFWRCYINLTLPCLTEIACNLKELLSEQLIVDIYSTFMKQLQSIYSDPSVFTKNYGVATCNEKGIARNLTLFLTSFFKSHILVLESSLPCMDLLELGHQYLIDISGVDDDQVFEICLDYWSSLVWELQCSSKLQRQNFYKKNGLLSKLRLLMICRMPMKLEGSVIQTDYDPEHYELMRTILRYLTILDCNDTKNKMMDELRKRRRSGWTSNNVYILSAIVSLSEMMQDMLECGFVYEVYDELTEQYEIAEGPEEKAFIGNIIMYACGKYAWWFGTNSEFFTKAMELLFYFMSCTFTIEDVPWTTFLMIFQKCKHNFAHMLVKRRENFVSKLLTSLTADATTTKLNPDQIQSIYESAGHIIQVENDICKRDDYLKRLMDPPREHLEHIIRQLSHDLQYLEVQEVTRSLLHILQIISRVASSLGDYFLGYTEKIFPRMIVVYRMCSEHICRSQGVSRAYFVKLFCSVKREILKLGPLFENSKVQGENGELYVEWMFYVLDDYCNNSPDVREAEVLSLFATFIDRYKEIMFQFVLRFEAVLLSTVTMMIENMEDYPEHRLKFFSLVEVTATDDLIFALINKSKELLDHVMYSIYLAVRSSRPDIAEAGLTILLKLLEKLKSSMFLNKFCEIYFVWIIQVIFGVLTDTLHKSGFELHVRVLQHLFKLMKSAEFEERRWTYGYFPHPNNGALVLHDTIVFLRLSFPNTDKVKLSRFVRSIFNVLREDASDEIMKWRMHVFLQQSQELSAEVYVGDPDFDNDPFFKILFSWLQKLRICIRPVRNQGPAAACWAFVASDTIYSEQVISNPNSVAYLPSVQDLIDRGHIFHPQMAYGEIARIGVGNMVMSAYRYAEVFGIYPDQIYAPFEPLYCCRTAHKPGQTYPEHIATWRPSREDDWKIYADGRGVIDPKDVRKIRSHLERQPLAATLMTTDTFMKWNSDGIYSGGPASPTDGIHSVVLVGFGGEVGIDDYFLIKNSWGSSWGHFGYAKITSNQILSVCYPIGCSLCKAP